MISQQSNLFNTYRKKKKKSTAEAKYLNVIHIKYKTCGTLII